MLSFLPIDPDLLYPDSDGQPMADNTEQYEWIVKIKENLEILFADNPQVFIAGDLLWYPVRDRSISGPAAPDVMVAFGRPKGRRSSYKQWEEDNIAPQVVFEILSPCNGQDEMDYKRQFYQRFGVEEYYCYDPPNATLQGWLRCGDSFQPILSLNGWISPRLGIRFETPGNQLEIYRPDGEKFLSSIELAQRLELAQQQAEIAQQQAEIAQQRAEKMAEYLRSIGVDPDSL
jgi:Uma2 family endonuclease